MKVGISDMYLDALGGGEKYMLSLAETLAKHHTVSLFWEDAAILPEITRRFAIDMSAIALAPSPFAANISTRERILKTREYDLIIHMSDGSIPVSFAKKTFLHIQHPLPWITKLSAFDRVKLSQITGIIYNSKFTQSHVDPLLKKKNIVLYPPAQMIGAKGDKDNRILTVGRYNYLESGGDFKKLGRMIDMFKKLVDQTHIDWEFTLVVTYKDSDKKHVEELIERTKGYKITFKTNVTNEELIVLYRSSKIYWHAAGFEEDLEKNPNRAEHFGISVVEAMSAGAIPIVIHAGGIPEIVQSGKNGYTWKTEEELLSQTSQVIEGKVDSDTLISNAIDSSKQYSQDAFREHVKEILTL